MKLSYEYGRLIIYNNDVGNLPIKELYIYHPTITIKRNDDSRMDVWWETITFKFNIKFDTEIDYEIIENIGYNCRLLLFGFGVGYNKQIGY